MIKIPAHIASISAPQFDVLNELAARRRARGGEVDNLGQALPGFRPPPVAIASLQQSLTDGESHIYSSVAGTPALREALAERLAADFGADIRPLEEIVITAGGNQAFMLALLTLAGAGDEIVLPAPYFLNHEMAVRTVGATPVEAPIPADRGFVPTWADLEPHLTPRTRGLVLVTPANPTGAVIPRAALQEIVDQAGRRELFVVVDETYKDFVYEGEATAGAALAGWRDAVICCGSFSKSYGITGWRCGYFAAAPHVVEQALKIQDTMIICAPVPVQNAITAILREAGGYPRQFLPALRRRRDIVIEKLGAIAGVHPVRPGGGFFVMSRVDGVDDSEQLARRLIDEARVVCMPGRFFGVSGEGYLRLSYSAIDTDRLAAACDRIASVLAARR